MVITALVAAIALAQAAPANSVQLSEPTTVAQLDSGKLKGEPAQLAWSDDGTQLFLEVAQRDAQGMLTKPRYYVVSASDGSVKGVDASPEWATKYWAWKSNKSSPASPLFAIDVKEDFRQVSATANPMGGAYAKGGLPDSSAGTTVNDAASAALQTQKQHVFSLTLKGENVGEFVNTQFVPGYTFGWSPRAEAMIAYGNEGGHLAVMDQKGAKHEVPATRNVILPAWSQDGTRIAFIQKTGKNKYDLSVVQVRSAG